MEAVIGTQSRALQAGESTDSLLGESMTKATTASRGPRTLMIGSCSGPSATSLNSRVRAVPEILSINPRTYH